MTRRMTTIWEHLINSTTFMNVSIIPFEEFIFDYDHYINFEVLNTLPQDELYFFVKITIRTQSELNTLIRENAISYNNRNIIINIFHYLYSIELEDNIIENGYNIEDNPDDLIVNLNGLNRYQLSNLTIFRMINCDYPTNVDFLQMASNIQIIDIFNTCVDGLPDVQFNNLSFFALCESPIKYLPLNILTFSLRRLYFHDNNLDDDNQDRIISFIENSFGQQLVEYRL